MQRNPEITSALSIDIGVLESGLLALRKVANRIRIAD